MTKSTIQATTGAAGLVVVTEAGQINVVLDNLAPEIVRQLALHGLRQKVCDAAAIPRNTETGLSATPAEKFAAMKRVADALCAGEWGVQREAGSGGGTGSLLLRALGRLYPNTPTATLEAKIAGWGKKEQAAMRRNPKIAAVILEIQAVDASRTGVDTDSMLADLGLDTEVAAPEPKKRTKSE
jgi:hypothetical protein